MLSPDSSPAAKAAQLEENLRRLPEPAQAAFRQYQRSGDAAALDVVLLAVLEDFIPKTPARPLSELGGETKLMEDLGFDSLAIAEVVFFTEDLLDIRIENEEILQVQTLDDLRRFVRGKVAGRAPG